VAEQIILLDTSVLIDFFRKKDKSKSYFYQLSDIATSFVVSSITHFEIYTGISFKEQNSLLTFSFIKWGVFS
jgi:tRNA(fMet)-specific endonuclease VapC